MRHDDYDYSELEELLPAPLREFLDLCCRPAGPLAPPALTFLSNKLNYTVKVRGLTSYTDWHLGLAPGVPTPPGPGAEASSPLELDWLRLLVISFYR